VPYTLQHYIAPEARLTAGIVHDSQGRGKEYRKVLDALSLADEHDIHGGRANECFVRGARIADSSLILAVYAA
jgi:hypothetical protein